MAEKQVSELRGGAVYGPYHLIRILGEGAGGQVWEADDSRSDRRVALKIMTELHVESPQALERFEREGRLAASVTHPSCVLVFGAEEVEGRPTISMELMRGGTLRDRLRDGPLDHRTAVRHLLDVIAGLEAAQLAGIIHRDVKPSNCFLDEGGSGPRSATSASHVRSRRRPTSPRRARSSAPLPTRLRSRCAVRRWTFARTCTRSV